MSYIPRPPTVPEDKPAAMGRADEVWSISGAYGSSPAGVQSVFGRIPNSPDKTGSVKLPSSTRASIVKVLSSDSPLPDLPPLPIIDPSAVSIINVSVGADAMSMTSSLHRRTASTGDERLSAPKPPLPDVRDVPDLATDNPPRPKSRLGLASLRLVWPNGKSRQRKATPESAGERSRWTVNEANLLAKTSLNFWKSGRPVDFAALSVNLGRSTRDIAEMLEHMLEGYARFGGVSCWDAQSQKFVMRWAAVEFPANPQLNLHFDRNKATNTVSRLDACFSALTCRPRSASKDLAYALDSPDITTSGQSVVADFREGMRMRNADYFSLNQSAAGTNANTPGKDDATKDERQQLLPKESKVADTVVAVVEPALNIDEKASSKGSTPNHSRSRSSTSIPQSIGAASTGTRPNVAFRAEPNAQPIFTGGLRSRQGLNTMNRETRARRTRKPSFKFEGASQASGAFNASVSTPFTFSSTLGSADAVSLSSVGAVAPAAYTARSTGRPRSSTVAHPPVHALASRNSRDSGTVEQPALSIPIVTMFENIELSPEQSRQMIEVRQPEGELDAQFRDLSNEVRQKVRQFVSWFIQEYPMEFQQRVESLKSGNDGLCKRVDHYAQLDYMDDSYRVAIERLYRHKDASLMFTRNIFFHLKLLETIKPSSMPVPDENWIRVNEFATQLFNKRIEDKRFVVMQEYRNSTSSSVPPSNSKDASRFTSEVRSRFASLAGSVIDEHTPPFDRAFYMDRMANDYSKFLMADKCDEIRLRVRAHGPRPMPVAVRVDRSKLLQFDIEIRDKLVGFIWEDIETSTIMSKEIALLRALELLNGEIAEQCGFYLENLPRIMNGENVDGSVDEDRGITGPEAIKGIPNGQIAQVVGRAFARSYFNNAKVAFLEAMIHNHPFRPLSRDELKDWRERGTGPFGEDVDYLLNSNLYTYLRQLNLRPSSKQWLQVSAFATLSMLRRTMNATTQKKYIAHIDIASYEAKFSSIVQDTRGVLSSHVADTNGVSHEPSAFDQVPQWVNKDQLRSAEILGNITNGVASRNLDGRATGSSDDTDSQSFQEIQQANGADDSGHQTQVDGDVDVNGSGQGSVTPAGREFTYPTISHGYSHTALLTTAPQMPSSNALLASPVLHPFTVPMPAANHHMASPTMPHPHIYVPYSPEMQRQMSMPMGFAPTSSTYGANIPTMSNPMYLGAYSSGGANISDVMQMLERTHNMIREMHTKKDS
ncbi:hypothetical protein IW147_005823 [Coemansia sp. RSA 720]|nr:hypothetical protein IW147_005823 [Coemansia sp. RSA 720]